MLDLWVKWEPLVHTVLLLLKELLKWLLLVCVTSVQLLTLVGDTHPLTFRGPLMSRSHPDPQESLWPSGGTLACGRPLDPQGAP